MSRFTSPLPKMPAGYRLLRLDTVDSTNAEARRRADMGEPGPLWIWSARQSKGRGRSGREWSSLVGNLFASLLIRLNCPLATASQLALVAGIVTYETIAKLIAYEGRAREETLLIDGKTYSAGGWEEQGPGETLPYHNEMLLVTLDDGTRIEYGAMPIETATFEQYLEIRDNLVRIVQSYRKLP